MKRNKASALEVRPLHDRVIVQRLRGQPTSQGGIVFPDNAKEKPREGRVIAVGPGRRDDRGTAVPRDAKRGDRVLFAKYAGRNVEIAGAEHPILQEGDILGVVQK